MLEQIHQMSIRILAEVGIRIDDDQMRSILKTNGIKLDKSIAYFTENEIETAISSVPGDFILKGRNASYAPCIGGANTHYLAGYGAPYILENKVRRKAMLEDYIKLVKLVHSIDEMQINGGILVQPEDLPPDKFQLILLYANTLFSDKALLGMTSSGRRQAEIIEFLKIVYDEHALTEQPVILTLGNTTSPLILDANFLQTLYVCALHRQPIIISPTPMAGTTGPINVAGNVALGNAEILAALTCAQLVASGAPVVYGLMAQPANMQTCQIDPGSPGAVVGTVLCAKLAQRYGLPSRGGTAPNAKDISVISGLESMMINFAAVNAGINLIVHAAGLLDRFNCVSPEQLLIDMDIIRRIEYYKKFFSQDLVGTLDTTYFHEIKKAGPGGNFLTAMSTLKQCRTEPFVTQIQHHSTDASQPENQAVIHSAQKKVDQMIERYKPPEIEARKQSKMRDLLVTFGVPKEILDRIDHQYHECKKVNK